MIDYSRYSERDLSPIKFKGPMPGTCVFPYSYGFSIWFARMALIGPCNRCADRTHRSHEDMATEGR